MANSVEKSLPDQADIVIIGGGAIGLCSAYYLQQSGRDVCLIEKGDLLSGCSGENAGLICPSHIEPLATPAVLAQGLAWLFRSKSPFRIKPRLDWGLFSWLLNFHKACRASKVRTSIPVLHQMLQQSRHLFNELCHGARLADLEERGLLMLHRSDKGFRGHQALADYAKNTGLPVEFLDKESLFEREPASPPASSGGIFFPTDAHLNPRELFSNMAAKLIDRGVQIHTGTAVTDIQKDGRITTSKGDVRAKQVLIAAGSWSAALAKHLKHSLPLQPGKGYTLTLPKPNHAPKTPIILAEEKVSITPLGQSLRFGGTLELAGFDPSINLKRTHNIALIAKSYVPETDLKTLEARHFWHGFRPCSPDGLPILGFLEESPKVAVATGHAMLGVSLAPITGKLIAELFNGSTTSMPIAPLSPQRF